MYLSLTYNRYVKMTFLIAFMISMPFVVTLGINNGDHSNRIYKINQKLYMYLNEIIKKLVNGRENISESSEVLAIIEIPPPVSDHEQPDNQLAMFDSIVNNGFGDLSSSDNNEFKYKYCKFI